MFISISVVIPLYNKEYSIEKCLESVLSQSSLPLEIIIVDDGSTDGGGKLVAALINNFNDFNNVKIRLFHQENKGVASARNYGMFKAEGEYVALLDADDEWDCSFLSEMMNLINEYPNAAMYSCFHRVKDCDGNFFVPYTCLQDGYAGYVNSYFEVSESTPLVNSSKVILRKNVALALEGFPLKASLTEDLYFWFLIASNYQVAHLNKVLVQINQFKDESRVARLKKVPFIIEFFSLNLKEFNALGKSQRSYLYSVHFKHILGSLVQGDLEEALKRINAGARLFCVKTCFLYFLFLIPLPLFSFIRRVKRQVRSRTNSCLH